MNYNVNIIVQIYIIKYSLEARPMNMLWQTVPSSNQSKRINDDSYNTFSIFNQFYFIIGFPRIRKQ